MCLTSLIPLSNNLNLWKPVYLVLGGKQCPQNYWKKQEAELEDYIEFYSPANGELRRGRARLQPNSYFLPVLQFL